MSDKIKGDIICCGFDVYDTCISRKFAAPVDLFYALGLKIHALFPQTSEASAFARRFMHHRILAERKANRILGRKRTAHISAVYRSFDIDLPASVTALIELEMELEREYTYPISETIEYINSQRAKGKRIIFISDMYLPRDYLEETLLRFGMMIPGDGLYVSSDSSLTKRSGELFKLVMQKEGISPWQLSYFGDDRKADLIIPRKLGIRASQFLRSHLTKSEHRLRARSLMPGEAASEYAALSKWLRLTADAEEAAIDSLLSAVAPTLVSFVDWVLRRAREEGIRRLYFVARDGDTLFRIASVLVGDSKAIELRYLHGSRQAWLAPSLDFLDDSWKRLLFTPAQSNSRLDVLKRLGLARDEAELISKAMGERIDETPLTEIQFNRFVDAMLAHDVAGRLLEAHVSRLREAVLGYLTQQNMFDGTPWALVDAGWSLNCQAALKRIVQGRLQGQSAPIGFYFGLAKNHFSADLAGKAFSFTPVGSIFSRRRVVIEHCFMPSPNASTIGYAIDPEGRFAPQFAAETRSCAEIDLARKVQAFAGRYAAAAASDPRLMMAIGNRHVDTCHMAAEFLMRPSREDALILSSMNVNADVQHIAERARTLCRRLGVVDIAAIVATFFSARFRSREATTLWLEGSAAISPFYVQMILWVLLNVDRIRQDAIRA